MGKTISLNFSARDIEDDSTVEFLMKCCKDYNMQNYVIIELLESESIIHYETIFRNIQRLKEHGIKIAIDDFGSGYSNFIYLSQFHANYIKIDGTLIKKLLTEKHSEAIITAISAFARDLDISLIAEFVSNEEEITRLKELNVEFSQGFYIGKPKPFKELNIKRSPKVKI